MLLAIDTSGRQGSIALFDGVRLLEERTLELGARHAQSLLPGIQSLLATWSVSPAQVERLAVAVGPGSFTGLRVGVTCARAWAYAAGCRITAVPTLTAVAARAFSATSEGGGTPRGVPFRFHAVVDAMRGELFHQVFSGRAGGAFRPVSEVRIVPAVAWLDDVQPGERVAGPGLAANSCPVSELRARGADVATEEEWLPRARDVGRCALEGIPGTEEVTAWELLPRYHRRSAAEEQWTRLGRD